MVVAANIGANDVGLTSTSFVWEEERVPSLPIYSKDYPALNSNKSLVSLGRREEAMQR